MSILLLLGCGPGPTVAETPLRTVPLCEPWASWDLPIGVSADPARSDEAPGSLVQCDERHLTVQFPPSSSAERAPDWRLAVRSAGWEEEVDSSAPGLVTVRYLQDKQFLDLSIIDEPLHTLVILTVVDRPPGKATTP